MYLYFGELKAYDLFNTIGFYACLLSSLFYFKSKQNAKSLYSRVVISFVSRKNERLGKIVEIILLSFESLLMAYMIDFALASFNRPLGKLVGTGANYFGCLFTISLIWFILCMIFVINPLKQIDIATMGLPVYLFFGKIACFLQGCCYGIPWEHGPYYCNPYHPGKQVPTQLIETFWVVLIFIFLLKYRKKAKPGTIFPMYMILYSATRFCSEFLRREDNVLWIFKTYHLFCIAGVVIGLLLLLIVKLFGDKIQNIFEKPHKKFELKIAQKEEERALKLAEEKALAEAAEIERLEKVRLARARAKARKK